MHNGDYLLTATGRLFWPLEPMPEDVHIEDIAHSLALQCRFGGHCLQFYSVAEHSVRVSQMVPPEDALWALLHDASEAYLTDLPRPLKRHSVLGSEYQCIEAVLMGVICERFGLSYKEPKTVTVADNTLLMTEMRDLMAPTRNKYAQCKDPLEDPLHITFTLSWDVAKAKFLSRFYELWKE